MAKTYKITFSTKSAMGIVLYELNAWGVPLSNYQVSETEYVIYHASAGVVDVITESLVPQDYNVKVETK